MASNNSKCRQYQLLESICPCLLKVRDVKNCTDSSLNLEFAAVRPIYDVYNNTCFDGDCSVPRDICGFHVYNGKNGLYVSTDSNFTIEDVEQLICECKGSSGSVGSAGSVEDPLHIDLSSNFTSCGIPVGEALPVHLVCDSSSGENVTLACTEDTNQLVFIDTSTFPATATLFDGTPHTGNVVPCEQDYKWVEREFCLDDQVAIRVTCWNILDPTNSQVIWVLPDGTTSQTQPIGFVPCSEDCNPYSASYYMTVEGVQPNTEQYNTISVHNSNKCCNVLLTTTAGTGIALPEHELCFQFDCLLGPEIDIQFQSDNPDQCDMSKVLVTLIRKS